MRGLRFRHPWVTFLLIAFVLNVDEWSYLSGNLPIPPVAWVALLALFALPQLKHVTALQHSPLVRFQSVLVVFALILAVIHGAPKADVNATFNQFGGLVFSVLCMLHLRRESVWMDVSRAMRVALAIGVFLMFMELFGVLRLSKTGGRAAGLWINPNLASLTLLGLILAISEVSRSTTGLVRSYLFGGSAIIISFSRGGILAAFILGLRQLATVGRVSVGGVVVGALVMIPAWWAFVNFLPEELVANANVAQRLALLRGESSLTETGLGHRVELIERALEKSRQSPVIGHGMATAQSFTIQGSQLGVHNEFLSMLVAYGFIGLLFFLGYLRALARIGLGTFVFYLSVLSMFWHSLLLVREVLFLCAYFEAGAFHARKRARQERLQSASVD